MNATLNTRRLLQRFCSRTGALLLAACSCTSGQAMVYRCIDEQGNTVYSDLGCRGRQVMQLKDIQVLEFDVPRSAAKSAPRGTRRSRASDKGVDAATHNERWQRRQACEQARRVLARIRNKRRQGYSIDEAAQLDAQSNAAKRDRQHYCR